MQKIKSSNGLKKERRDENIEKGREIVEKEIRALDFEPKDVLTAENIAEVANKFSFAGEEDMFAAAGYGGISPKQIVNRLTEKLRKQQDQDQEDQSLAEALTEMQKLTPKKRTGSGVRVKGVDNMLIRLSRCCTPVPGDDIVGYITKGRGVSIHRSDCQNVQNEEVQNRLLPVEWEGDQDHNKSYNVDIEIIGFDRNGLLNEVLHAVTEARTVINAVSGRSDNRYKMATIHMTILIHNIDHLHRVVDKIKQLKDIYSVRRIMH